MREIVLAELPPRLTRKRRRLLPLFVVGGAALLGAGVLLEAQILPALAGRAWDGWMVAAKSKQLGALSLDAVPAGHEGELTLFPCRAQIGRDIHIGRIRRDFAGCHIGFNGKEVEIKPFETLTATWTENPSPADALVVGAERAPSSESPFDVTQVFACRAPYQGGMHPGQLREGTRQCSFGYGGRGMVASAYEVLLSAPWLSWQGATARDIPQTAVVAGSEGGEAFFLCRAADPDGLHPGKVKRNSPGCSIASDGREVIAERFEVLISHWVAGRSGSLPVSAFPAGWEGGRAQYACQAETPSGAEIGKVNEALGGCHIGMLGREVVVEDYQVLSQ